MLKKDDLIYIAGHRGLVGSAILKTLNAAGYKNILVRTHEELNLENATNTELFFKKFKPQYIFLCAARAGGIYANLNYPADFIRENLMIQTNVIHSAYKYGSKKLMFFGSSCVYPKNSKQPITENSLLTGELESSNLPYAIAKIAGISMCNAYVSQYGFNSLTVMPCNVYGVEDNFHPENSHVIAGMMKRFHEAKVLNKPSVEIWGSGNPLREFINSDDLARACLFLMETYEKKGVINVGSSQEISIRNLAELLKNITEFEGDLIFNDNRQDGVMRKIMDNSNIFSMGWKPNVTIENGIAEMYKWFLAKNNN